MTAYYNEIDPYAAEWLRNLIKAGHIAPGVVDERGIEDVKPAELAGFTQCHFFAGVGVWSYALRRAGWPDRRPVWTGSCPCQPFSAAGAGGGFDDGRHLWPAWLQLIGQCRPDAIFGEQVASRDGLGWLDLVLSDLEGAGYACGALDMCAAGVGAPHLRQRLWLFAQRLADADSLTRGQGGPILGGRDPGGDEGARRGSGRNGVPGGLADADPDGRRAGGGIRSLCEKHDAEYGCDEGGRRPGPTNGLWRAADWLACRDGKWRPVEPGAFPLAHGAAARVGRLRAYGNAINAEAASAVIRAFLDVDQGRPRGG